MKQSTNGGKMLGWLKNRRKRYTFKIEAQRDKWNDVKYLIEQKAQAHGLKIYYATLFNPSVGSTPAMTVSIQICGRAKDVDQYRIWLATFWTSPWAKLRVA